MVREPIQVLGYCFKKTDDGHEYLLLKRNPTRGSFWQGVTGATEKNESLIDAASRELKEETGIIPEYICQVDYSYSFPVESELTSHYPPNTETIREFVFLAEVKPTTIPSLSFEHVEYCWVHFTEGLNLLKWLNNRDALKYCESWLEKYILFNFWGAFLLSKGVRFFLLALFGRESLPLESLQ